MRTYMQFHTFTYMYLYLLMYIYALSHIKVLVLTAGAQGVWRCYLASLCLLSLLHLPHVHIPYFQTWVYTYRFIYRETDFCWPLLPDIHAWMYHVQCTLMYIVHSCKWYMYNICLHICRLSGIFMLLISALPHSYQTLSHAVYTVYIPGGSYDPLIHTYTHPLWLPPLCLPLYILYIHSGFMTSIVCSEVPFALFIHISYTQPFHL